MAALTEQDWTLAALRALGAGGIRGVRVEVLASELGVTKGSFYHHFKRRQDLLDAMLRQWIQLGTERIIRRTDAATTDPVQRLLQLSLEVFADVGVYENVDAAVRDWAGLDERVAKAVADVDTQRMAYVAALIAATGIPEPIAAVRAELMYKALIGEFTWRRHGGPQLNRFAIEDMVAMLITPHQTLPSPPMPPLPESATLYQCTPEYTEQSIPQGLLHDHSTKAGTWGMIVVLSGRLRYQIEEGPSFVLTCDLPGVIAPKVLHRVEAMGTVRFRVDFYRLVQG